MLLLLRATVWHIHAKALTNYIRSHPMEHGARTE